MDKWALRNFLGKEGEDGMSSKTRRRRLSTIRGFFDYLVMLKKLNDNPAAYILAPKIEKKIPAIIQQGKRSDPKNRQGKSIDNSYSRIVLRNRYQTQRIGWLKYWRN